MKTISIYEFEALVDRNDWHREQEIEVINNLCLEVERWDEENESLETIEINKVFGLASKISTIEGIKITYTESFSYEEFQADSLSTDTEGQDDAWYVDGVVVVDKLGDEIDPHDLADYMDSDFRKIDYRELYNEQITDIDLDKDSEMETFTLEIDNSPNIRFTGDLLGFASSSENKSSGSAGRWTEISLYKTKIGKLVCHQVGCTSWLGERARYSGKVCENLNEVKEFFGHGWLAKDLYKSCGIDDCIEVE